jgi:Cu/Ag efflux pump CusA
VRRRRDYRSCLNWRIVRPWRLDSPLAQESTASRGRTPLSARLPQRSAADCDVADAQKAVATQVKMPSGYYVVWSGQFEYLERSKARLQVVVPVTVLVIFLLLYLNFPIEQIERSTQLVVTEQAAA